MTYSTELIIGYVMRVNGELYRVCIGITKGNPLSPLLGAVYLKCMDDAISDYCAKRDYVITERLRLFLIKSGMIG